MPKRNSNKRLLNLEHVDEGKEQLCFGFLSGPSDALRGEQQLKARRQRQSHTKLNPCEQLEFKLR